MRRVDFGIEEGKVSQVFLSPSLKKVKSHL
mgnify:CR=1 FL=1